MKKKGIVLALIFIILSATNVMAKSTVEVFFESISGEPLDGVYQNEDEIEINLKSNSDTDKKCTVLGVAFKDNVITEIKIQKDILVSKDVSSFNLSTKDSEEVKVFVWENLDSMIPVIDTTKIKKGVKKSAIYVSPNGNDNTATGKYDAPYKSIQAGVDSLKPGTTLYILDGTYNEQVYIEKAGTEDNPIVIKAAPGAVAKINGGMKKDTAVIELAPGASDITIEGLEVFNGGHGIYYEDSTKRSGKNITIKNNIVHDIEGTDAFGIVVYAHNLNPTTNVIIDGNEVYDCKTGSSETVTVNGNVDGFVISNNIIHDDNNIGMVAIGYEGTCKDTNLDAARNGVFRNNTIYNVSTYGNPAYKSGSDYDLCCAGIYVDGGHDILIEDNNITNCDIGIEVASEHKDKVAYNVIVKNNKITDCNGFGGISFGGYEGKVGFARDCVFEDNTLLNNDVGFIVQQAQNNIVQNNTIVGGGIGLLFSFVESDGKLVYKGYPHYGDANDFRENSWDSNGNDEDEYYAWFQFLPEAQRNMQIVK